MTLEQHEELVQQLRRKDVRAMEPLAQLFRSQFYLMAVRIVSDKHQAMDLAHEALLKVYDSAHSFRQEGSFRSWAFKILRNHCLNYLKSRKRTVSLDALHEEHGFERTAPDPMPQQVALTRERDRILWGAIRELRENHREIILMKDYHDLKYREIAEILDIPIGTVMSRLHKAREGLRGKLEGLL